MSEIRCPHCGEPYVLKTAHKLKNGMWAGRPAFVLGGGPSLTRHGALYDIPNYGYTIATNRALELPMRIDMWTWMETQVFQWASTGAFGEDAHKRFLLYDGIYVARRMVSRNYQYPHYVTLVKGEPNIDLGEGVDTFVNGHSNVGFWAMNLAFCLGADPIVLIGFDQKGTPNNFNEWWHDGYPKKARKVDNTYRVMRRGFEHAAQQAEQIGRRIWVVGPSTLTCFKVFPTLDEVLSRLSERVRVGNSVHATMEG